MLAHVTTFAIQGVESRRVTVEVDIRPGLPAFTIVGLGDRAVRESRERVRSAILNSGFEFPARRITVNLAPAALRKEGPGFDLAIACGVLGAVGELPASVLERVAIFGELALGGELRPCRGVLAVAEGAVASGLGGLVLPAVHGREAGLVEDLGVYGATGLAEVVAILRGESDGQPPPPDDDAATAPVGHALDLADVRGHGGPLRALTIAAAGGHNLLLAGPPGTGKTMLAQRLPSILPPLSRAEAIEVTRIQGVAGMRAGRRLGDRAPVSGTAPHDLGVRAGRRWLAADAGRGHAGPSRRALPRRAGGVRAAGAGGAAPAAGGRPRGDRARSAPRGLPDAVHVGGLDQPVPVWLCRYVALPLRRGRHRPLPPAAQRPAAGSPRPAGRRAAADARATSRPVRCAAARPSASAWSSPASARRRGWRGPVRCATPTSTARWSAATCALDPAGAAVLRRAYDRGTLSPRGHDRVLRVARTIADLEGARPVGADHLLEALGFRQDVADGDEADAA